MSYTRNPRQNQRVLPGIMSGIMSVGFLYPTHAMPARYPLSHEVDMEAIGKDMWRAVGAHQSAKTNKT